MKTVTPPKKAKTAKPSKNKAPEDDRSEKWDGDDNENTAVDFDNMHVREEDNWVNARVERALEVN